ncbi:MAG: heavy metal translocating P-type ATPase metal-binding domain-containing protein [Myxococcales bacterium]|nr:heavy metal translocating P-type ATPase metal-binding domain-containing protein [Myxococcales bacterium]
MSAAPERHESEITGSGARPLPLPEKATCRHCALPLPLESSPWVRDGFCCPGCKTVHGVLRSGGLDAYYRLRGGVGVPVGELGRSERAWVEEVRGKSHLDLDVQGIHCAGCVWVLEELFQRHGRGNIELDPTLGRAAMLVTEDFDLDGFVDDVEALGYRLGPASDEDVGSPASDALLVRTGICLALAGNGMLFAAASYFGLDVSDGAIYRLLTRLAFGAATLAVLVGGSVFVKAAWQGLRRGVVHLDVPIALGVVLSYGGATWSFVRDGEARYADTVTIFIALMLLGRWLQERLLERNRRQLLADHGAEALRTRKVRRPEGEGADAKGDVVALVPAVEVREGDVLQLGAGDLVPVEATLLPALGEGADDEGASFSLDWIDGESEPREVRVGETIPAGAFYVGLTARRVRASESFETSAVRRLLQKTRAVSGDPGHWWQRVARWYVLGVLVVAAGAFATWWALEDAARAVEVATAVLVVTCPCAFGIATPLAYELAHGRLRRRGLFVRTRGFLDRARDVTRVVFDKTGTLTTGRLRLVDEAPLDALTPDELGVLASLAAASMHPKSQAVARALEARAIIGSALDVCEVAGRGVSVSLLGVEHRLGAPSWAAEGARVDGADLVYAIGGRARAALRTEERLRPDAAAELAALADAGYETWILSGDDPRRVAALAAEVGVPAERALGGRDPDAKAAFVAAHDPDHTLMIGDGLNDSLAATTALCAGTPAIDRPFLASRSDFYFTTPGLGPILDALATAAELGRTVRALLAFAVAYNVVAVTIAWLGFMQPWLAAILMPASSIASLAYALMVLGPRTTARRALLRRSPALAPAR